MRVLIAPDKFKGTLTAAQAAAAMSEGWLRARAHDDVDRLPMADGGEGTMDALLGALGGERHETVVTGPVGEPVTAEFGLTGPAGNRTAIIEIARASGLQLVPPTRRDVMRSTTFGTGELIRAACDEGVREVVVCLGGSATNDGGAGMAQAVGVGLFDGSGAPIGSGGVGLLEVARIDASTLEPRVRSTRFVAAADVDNPLTGPTGAAETYARQKGASDDDVVLLARALDRLAAVIARDLGVDVRELPGAGAAGGLGAGAVAFLRARLRRGSEVVMDAVGFDERLTGSDLVVTGEGRFDEQSLRGKVVGAVLHRAEHANVPAVVICGEADIRPNTVRLASLVERFGRDQAIEDAERGLRTVAEDVARAIDAAS